MPNLNDLQFLLAQQQDDPMASFDPSIGIPPPAAEDSLEDDTARAPSVKIPTAQSLDEDEGDYSTPPSDGPSSPLEVAGSSIQNPSVRNYMMQKLAAQQAQMGDAQEQARQNRMGVGIAQALSQGIGAATGAKSSEGLYHNLSEQANSPVTDLKAQNQGKAQQLQLINETNKAAQDADEHDPNSKISRASQDVYSNVAKKLGVKPDTLKNLSKSDIDGLSKGLIQLDQIDQRAQDNKLKYAMIHEQKETNRLMKDQSLTDKEEKDLRDSVRVDKASSRSPLGKAQLNHDLAQRADAFFSRFRDPKTGQINYDKIPAAQGLEGIRALDTMMSNNGSTVSGMEHMAPSSAMGDLNSWLSYTTNEQRGAGQGSWYKGIHDAIKREASVAGKQAKDYLQKNANMFEGGGLATRHPDRYKHIVEAALPPEAFDPEGAGEATVHIRTSDGQEHVLPAKNLKAAQQRDPNLQVIQ